jgi:hypothetical protein
VDRGRSFESREADLDDVVVTNCRLEPSDLSGAIARLNQLVAQDFAYADIVDQIAEARREQEFYSIQTVRVAVEEKFPRNVDDIMRGIVEMLTFDALVGNIDRHPLNWGVITSANVSRSPRFSPVFDTARALFWNIADRTIIQILLNQQMFDKYIRKTFPQIGWDRQTNLGHFDLIRNIQRDYPCYRLPIAKYAFADNIEKIKYVLQTEFIQIMSDERRRLILECLNRRQQMLRDAVLNAQN